MYVLIKQLREQPIYLRKYDYYYYILYEKMEKNIEKKGKIKSDGEIKTFFDKKKKKRAKVVFHFMDWSWSTSIRHL